MVLSLPLIGQSSGADLISFTIDDVAYQAETGMTWYEWCQSTYNTGGWECPENSATMPVFRWEDNVRYDIVLFFGPVSTEIYGSNEITADTAYSSLETASIS